MPPNIDLTGKRFSRFVCLEPSRERDITAKDWLCQCDCGQKFLRRQREILKGLVQECPNCVFRRSEFYIGGKKFGRIYVLDKYRMEKWGDKKLHSHRVWKCKCECGKEDFWVDQYSITSGKTISCGCFMAKNNSRYVNETLYPKRAEISSKNDPTYQLWTTLNQKCYNPKYPQYFKWGGNGYTVCDLWRNDRISFTKWLLENQWTKKMTIVCKEGKKEFSPDNCYLITFLEYCKILKRENDREKFGIFYKGKTKTIKDWATEYGIEYSCLRSRMVKNNYNLEYCLNMKKMGNSGERFKRDDIKNEQVLELYNSGLSCQQIKDKIGFSPYERLKKMGVKFRGAWKSNH